MAIGDLAIYQDNVNTQSVTTEGSYEGVEFANPVTAASIYVQNANDIDVRIDETGYYLVVYQIRGESSAANRNQWLSYVMWNSVIQEGSYGFSYERNAANNELYVVGHSIVKVTSTGQNLRVEWTHHGENGATTQVTKNSDTYLYIVKIEDTTPQSGVEFGRYSDAAGGEAFSGVTWNNVTWDTIEEETDTSVIQKQTSPNDYQLRLKETGKYLVRYSVCLTIGSTTRSQRIARLTLGGSAVENSESYVYLRESDPLYGVLTGMCIVNNTVANQDLVLQIQRGNADVDGTITRTANRSGIDVWKLPSAAEVCQYYDSTGGQQIAAASNVLMNWAETLDFEDTASFDNINSTTIEVKKAGNYLFFANSMVYRSGETGSTRMTDRIEWLKNDTPQYDLHGTYIRGDQSSADTWNGGFNPAWIAYNLAANDDIELRVNDDGDNGNAGDYTVANRCGFGGLNLDTLQGSTEYSKTFTIDSYIQDADVTKTFTIDAYIQDADVTKAVTVDAHIADEESQTVTIDAHIADEESQTFTIDGRLQKQASQTVTIDGRIQKEFSDAVTIDGRLQKQFSQSVTIDSYIFKEFSETFTIDGYLSKADVQKTVTIDAHIAEEESQPFTIDAHIAEEASKTVTIDGRLQKELSQTVTIDSYIQKQFSETFTIDVRLQKQFSQTFTIDAHLAEEESKTVAIDAYLKKDDRTQVFTIDTHLAEEETKTVTIDSYLQKQLSQTGTIDAYLKEPDVTKTFTIDAWMGETPTKTVTVDAYLAKDDLSKTFTIDGSLQKQFSQTYTIDAYLQKQFSQIVTIDGSLQKQFSQTATVDAYMSKEFDETFTTDAYLQKELSQTHTVDTYLQKQFSQTVSVDSHISEEASQTFTADAYIQKQQSQTHTIDAYVQKQFSTTVTTDAYLAKDDIQKTFTIDAQITEVTEVQKTFTIDTYIEKTITKTHTVDAYIFKEFNKTFTIDTIIDSLIKPRGVVTFEEDPSTITIKKDRSYVEVRKHPQ